MTFLVKVMATVIKAALNVWSYSRVHLSFPQICAAPVFHYEMRKRGVKGWWWWWWGWWWECGWGWCESEGDEDYDDEMQERWGKGWCSNFHYSWLQEMLNKEAECTVQATFPDFKAQVTTKWGRFEAVCSILNALHILIQICISYNDAFVPLALERRHHTDNFQMCRGLWSFLLPKSMKLLY